MWGVMCFVGAKVLKSSKTQGRVSGIRVWSESGGSQHISHEVVPPTLEVGGG